MIYRKKRFENKKKSTRYQNIENDQYNLHKNKIRLVQSQQNFMPQRLKFDKNVLKFTGCFIGYVKENTYENYRIRTCNIFFLD